MTQLRAGRPSARWKEPPVSPGCQFGVKSYLHHFYDGPESVDLDLYEDEGLDRSWRLQRLGCCRCRVSCLWPLLLLSLLLLASAGGLLLLLLLLPRRLALLPRPADAAAAQLVALAAGCVGASGALITTCLLIQTRPSRRAPGWYPATPPVSPIETQQLQYESPPCVPATAQLVSIQPEPPPRYDVTQELEPPPGYDGTREEGIPEKPFGPPPGYDVAEQIPPGVELFQ